MEDLSLFLMLLDLRVGGVVLEATFRVGEEGEREGAVVAVIGVADVDNRFDCCLVRA